MLEAISSYDKKDSTSINKKRKLFKKLKQKNIKGMKIGIPKEYRVDNMPKEIEQLWSKGIDILKKIWCKNN